MVDEGVLVMETVKKGRKKGFKADEEMRFNYAKSNKKRAMDTGLVCGLEIRPVIQLSKKDGKFIEKYDSAKDALKALGKPTNRSEIGHCCRGFRNRKSAFGFAWVYEEDFIEVVNGSEFWTLDSIYNFIINKYNN